MGPITFLSTPRQINTSGGEHLKSAKNYKKTARELLIKKDINTNITFLDSGFCCFSFHNNNNIADIFIYINYEK